MGRKATTGKFTSREELEAEVRRLYFSSELKMASIASICKVSSPTVSKIINRVALESDEEPVKKKKNERESVKKKTNGHGIVGKWCSCWQKVDGVKRVPFTGRIVSGDLKSNWWKLTVAGEQVTVSRGACGTPYER